MGRGELEQRLKRTGAGGHKVKEKGDDELSKAMAKLAKENSTDSKTATMPSSYHGGTSSSDHALKKTRLSKKTDVSKDVMKIFDKLLQLRVRGRQSTR